MTFKPISITTTLALTATLMLAGCGSHSADAKDSSSAKDKSASIARSKSSSKAKSESQAKASSNAKASSIASSKAASSSKAKVASEVAASSKAIAESQSRAKAASESSNKAAATAQNTAPGYTPAPYPPAWQGNWYSYDTYANKLHQITITGNKWTTDGVSTYQFGGPRSAHDQAILDGKAQPSSADVKSSNANIYFEGAYSMYGKTIYLQAGWYQVNGARVALYMTTPTINGKSIQVITRGNSAALETEAHYYRSAELANQQKDIAVPTDIGQDQ